MLFLPSVFTAMLQLNGNFGNEVHTSSEASKQVNVFFAAATDTVCKFREISDYHHYYYNQRSTNESTKNI